MKAGGTYALVIYLNRRCTITVGKLGVYQFLPGFYIYAGSALGGLAGRLKRHLRQNKGLRWHIDYLLQVAAVQGVWYTNSGEPLECAWNRIIVSLPDAVSPVTGFGSSDCRCRTHLPFFTGQPSFDLFKAKCKEAGLPQPESSSARPLM